ncbi:MAG TPA: ATP-binding protein [Polyangiaceae bacterium]
MSASIHTVDATRSDAPRSSIPALDDLPDGVLVVRQTGEVESANRVFLEATQRQLESIVGMHLTELVAEEDVLHLVGFEAVFGGDPVQDGHVIFIAPDGARRPLIVSSSKARDGRVLLTTRASSAVHRELADASRWAASEQDRADEIGRARDALETKNAALRAAQEEVQRAYTRLRSEVEARERLEGELRLAQKLEAIGHLAAGVAHEINTPMQYIGDNLEFLRTAFARLMGYLDSVHAALAPHEALQKEIAAAQKKARLDFLVKQVPGALSASQQGVDHVSKIVRAMKSFAHPDSDHKSPGDVNQAIRDTLVVAQNEYKNVATVEADLAELPPVNCFIGKLNQVFLNVIVNAAHAIADAKREELGKIFITSRLCSDGGPDVVEVRIRDDGGGIPEAIRRKVFDQFFTTKEVGRGTGQGLSLSRSIIVEAHGGTISFETEVGVGTTFIIRLPVDGATRLQSLETAHPSPEVSLGLP